MAQVQLILYFPLGCDATHGNRPGGTHEAGPRVRACLEHEAAEARAAAEAGPAHPLVSPPAAAEAGVSRLFGSTSLPSLLYTHVPRGLGRSAIFRLT